MSMKFDPAASPLGPTPQQFADLGDLLITVEELYGLYSVIEQHPEIKDSLPALELFSVCRDQLAQESYVLKDLIEYLRTGYRSDRDKIVNPPDIFQYDVIPDIKMPSPHEAFLNLVRQALKEEAFLEKQLTSSLQLAQTRNHLKVELQLKMAILAAGQRQTLLDDKYGAELSKTLLDGLKRKTSRLFSVISRTGRVGLR